MNQPMPFFALELESKLSQSLQHNAARIIAGVSSSAEWQRRRERTRRGKVGRQDDFRFVSSLARIIIREKMKSNLLRLEFLNAHFHIGLDASKPIQLIKKKPYASRTSSGTRRVFGADRIKLFLGFSRTLLTDRSERVWARGCSSNTAARDETGMSLK